MALKSLLRAPRSSLTANLPNKFVLSYFIQIVSQVKYCLQQLDQLSIHLENHKGIPIRVNHDRKLLIEDFFSPSKATVKSENVHRLARKM